MSGDMFAKSILGLATAGQSKSLIQFGIVESLEPLKVKVDAKKTLTKDFLVLSQFVAKKEVETELHNHGNPNNTNQTVKVVLWEGMKVGDKVSMIEFNNGQSYYVLEVVS